MDFATYLCIKQHTVTGKLYFCKTTKKDPVKYKGSGLYWSRHIKAHGRENVVNLWCELFTSQKELTTFALEFSEKMNIVKSDQWLNFRPENGIDGAPSGYKHSLEAISKMKIAANNRSPETHARMSLGQRNKAPASAETRAKISLANENSSVETRAKISAAIMGSNNGAARKINFQSPSGEIFESHGKFRNICKDLNLPFSTMQNLLHKPDHQLTKKSSCFGWKCWYVT